MTAILDKKPLTPSASFPRKPPMKNYVPFENPEPRCANYLCPSFALPSCIYCKLHCEKFHKGRHIDDSLISNLTEKYSQMENDE